MANIIPVDNWSDIPQIEQTDKVLGGEGQIANQQAQALANRVENLKNTVTNNKTTQDNKNDSIDSAINDLNTNKVNKSDIVNNSTTTASGKVLDGRMGKTLNDAITSNYNTLNTNKVNKSDVVNNYTTTTAGKVLDARVGASLKTLIDGKQPSGSYVLTSNVVNVLNTTVSGKVLDARAGKTLNDSITSNYNTLNTNKVNISDIADNLTTNNASKVLSAKQGYVLKGLIDTANTNINTKINISDIADNLTSDSSTKVLSAKQGKILKGLIDTANTNITNLSNNKVNKSDIVNNTTTTSSGKVLDGRMGKTLNDLITTANTNITNLNNNKVNKTDIVDSLTSTATNKPLSANQGKVLNDKLPTVFIKSGSTAKQGLVPKPSTTAGTTKFLCEDATWKVPSITGDGVKTETSSSSHFTCCELTFSNNFKLKFVYVTSPTASVHNSNEILTFLTPFTSVLQYAMYCYVTGGRMRMYGASINPNIGNGGWFDFDQQGSTSLYKADNTGYISKTACRIGSDIRPYMIIIYGV
ncbi:hypothetical protein J6W34_04580 [bacterium]|nr:hypothetical protein [bacterium]